MAVQSNKAIDIPFIIILLGGKREEGRKERRKEGRRERREGGKEEGRQRGREGGGSFKD